MLHDGATAAVDLYWIPLGAGGHSVRVNGIVYEHISSLIDRRPRREIYHAALDVLAPSGRFAIEMTPVPNRRGWERGVVAGRSGRREIGGATPDLPLRDPPVAQRRHPRPEPCGGQSASDQRRSRPGTPHPRAAPLDADADMGP
jgi:hypothetical protein